MKHPQEIIDYMLVYKAIEYFSKKGFKQIEVPWRVSKEAIEGTFDSRNSFTSDDKFLIGSAEQGFLELYLQSKLNFTQMMSISPCFRNEVEDYYHQQEFLKLELIYFSKYEIHKEDIQYQIFRKYVRDFIIKKLKIKTSDVVILSTNEANSIYSEDIMINGVEYGSYGIRKFKDIYYIYGTGIALPRASKILKLIKGENKYEKNDKIS